MVKSILKIIFFILFPLLMLYPQDNSILARIGDKVITAQEFKARYELTPQLFRENKKIVKEKELTEFDKMLKNALSIREKLYKKLKSKDQYQTRYNLDIIQSIDDFILKIKELINLTTEIDEIIEANSNDEIDAYLIKLKEKLNTTENDELKREYNKSISQHEREKQSLIDLTNQKEIIYLRITNALSSLKQLEIDFTRIKGVVTKENDASVKIFTETSLELSNYVDNIKQSYQNLERTLE